MSHTLAPNHGGEPNPVDTTGLCLLSLDGGGVRGLSTLYILKGLMKQLNHECQQKGLPIVKPCEVFDLIGGTSTGGLIAIMLGRLEMDVDECISAYSKLMESVFEKKSSRLPVGLTGGIKAQFDSTRLKKAIEEVIISRGVSTTDFFDDGSSRGCRVFVCTTAKETAGITRLRSYSLPDEFDIPATICDAALATSAATGFFDPVSIGARQFVDGALGANNPVEEVEGEASDIWCSESGNLKPLVKCFISIGTGKPGKKAIEDDMLKFLSRTLVSIATETETTATRFISKWRQHYKDSRYFRFNVEQGLQGVGLAEYKERGTIDSATDEYLRQTEQKFRVQDCVQNLRQKQNRTDTTFAAVVHEYKIRIIRLQTTPGKACWTVPFERNRRFVGREAQLERLESMVFTEGQPSKVAITGLGGVGKTQVVLELAYRAKERYPDCTVFWLPAINTESLQQAYFEAGRQLGIAGLEEELADVKKLVQRHLNQESAGQWLLIFDNADDIDMWIKKDGNKDVSPALKDYLPRSSQGRIVFTTRSMKVALKLAQQNVIKVSEMDDDMARQLLRQSLIHPDVVTNGRDTRELLRQLTSLPLAIVQAAAYINENGSSVSDYLSLLEEQEQEVIDLLSEDFEDEGRYQELKNPIATTWLISFEQIQRLDPLAADYLSFMCCIDPKDIPQLLLPLAQSRKKEMDALGTLTAYSFVSRRPTDNSLDLHRLVHLATRNWLRKEESIAQWTQKAITRLNKVFPEFDHTNRRKWRIYLPHTRYALDSTSIEEDTEGKTELLRKFFTCLYYEGRYNEVEKFAFQIRETSRRVLGEEHPLTLASMGNLASIFWYQGRWKEAEKLEVQMMETSKKVLGKKHPDTLTSMANLASTYRDQGRWKKAEKLGVQVMKTRKRVLGEEHLLTLASMGNLASIFWNQSRWKEAEELEVQVMETRKRALGKEHPDTLTSMANLASTFWNQGRWKEAEELEVQVMKTRKRVLGEEHPDTLTSMHNLAFTWKSQERDNKACEMMRNCFLLRKQKLGADHPYTQSSRATLFRWEPTTSITDD